jgi:hypothetical protein
MLPTFEGDDIKECLEHCERDYAMWRERKRERESGETDLM